MRQTLLLFRRRGVLCVFLLFPPWAAAAQCPLPSPDAFRLLAQAITAKRNQHFIARQDILLSQGGAAGETRIVADIARDGGRFRLAYRLPAGTANRIEVDDGHVFQQWEPSKRQVLVDQSQEQTPAEQMRMLDLLHRNYRCFSAGAGAVNGLPCDLIVICPRCLRGASKRVWVDRVHHAILRTEEFDGAGRRRYFSFYETVRFVRRVAPGLFRLAGMGPVRRMPRQMRDAPGAEAAFAAAGLQGRLPAWLPPGYVMLGCALATSPGDGRAAILRYGDGLQTFCVFEERDAQGRASAPVGPLRRQIARSGARAWEMTTLGLCVTVIGDVMQPDSLGGDVLQALSPATEAILRSRLAQEFGPGALSAAAPLRGLGWGYDEIVSVEMYLRRHPEKARAAERWGHGQDWAQVMSGLRAASSPLEPQARAWMAAALRPSKSE